MAKGKKEKYQVKVGITGYGEDYNIYQMNTQEKAIAYFIGVAAGFAGTQILFGVWQVSLVLGLVVGFFVQPVAQQFLFNKRAKNILLQFRELLDSLSNSFSAGKNTPDAFGDAINDMRVAFGEDAPITKEVAVVLSGLHNNYTIEALLTDMAVRCGCADMVSFADTFAVCNRMGGNLKKIVTESRDIISDKIEIQMEIQTILSASKNEINIMAVMPFLIILMMGTMGDAAITGNSAINVVVKLVALAIFIGAYMVGRHITKIRV